jgi:hypothetical protein
LGFRVWGLGIGDPGSRVRSGFRIRVRFRIRFRIRGLGLGVRIRVEN